jgi:Potential Queuosine, Q, salvage protein family
MEELLQKHDFDNEDIHLPAGIDTLGVLPCTYRVVEQGELVWIDRERVGHLVDQWTAQSETGKITAPAWYDAYHFFDGTERTVNWILVLDALNFCFWPEKGQSRWTVEYHGTTLNGYLAEAAALTRAVEEQLPLWDAQYLSTMSENDLAHIFRGQQCIPLLEQRLYNVREVGRVLLERYDGQFVHAIEQAGYNAVQLALLLAREFSSFHDVALYRGKEVRFLKRAQICVADIYGAFGGKSWGALTNMDQLTAFADYKLPQILRHVGVLEYAPALTKQVDNQELIEAGSEEEVEIRAATVWSCELLRQEMAKRGSLLTAAEIDLRLWLLGQHVPDMKPYHRTRTIFY